MRVDLTWFLPIAMALVPVITAFITAQTAHPGLKAIVMIVWSGVSGFLIEWHDAYQSHTVFNVNAALSTAIVVSIGAISAHFGVLAPLVITGSEGKIQAAVPRGIGASRAVVVDESLGSDVPHGAHERTEE
jgi:hypothetical protein